MLSKEDKETAKRVYQKAYRGKNKERLKLANKQWRKKNKDKLLEKRKQYYINNRETIIKRTTEYDKINRERVNERRCIRRKHRRETEPLYNLIHSIRGLIGSSFKEVGSKKKSKTSTILGCSFEEFKAHLEEQFEPWMNWNNKGLYNGELNYGWDIDHIVPISSAITEEDIIRLNHYMNLQPLCSKINRDIKRDTIN
tara:strand:+ start:34377 stop:34967 length:591 start_codon:yes stop_codon:yes gene_type:complete